MKLLSKFFLAVLLLTVTGVSWGAELTVVSPNGGERWYTNSEYQIRWNTHNQSDIVRLFLYRWEAGCNCGSTFYRLITSSTPNDGSYTWKIPGDIPSGVKYILVTDSGVANQNHDYSDDYFTLLTSTDDTGGGR